MSYVKLYGENIRMQVMLQTAAVDALDGRLTRLCFDLSKNIKYLGKTCDMSMPR